MYRFVSFWKHRPNQRGQGRKRACRFRPRFERLEDRVVPSLFATGNNGTELISINTTTGAATVVGSFPPGNQNAAFEDAFTPDGTLWTFLGYGPQQLANVNTTNGTLTPVGSPVTGVDLIRGLESDTAGNLYADTLSGGFYRVNVSTGQLTFIGSFGFSGVNFLDMARDSSGNFYVVGAVASGNTYYNYLFQVNTTTGQATPLVQIANITDPVGGLMIDPATNMFYITNYDSSGFFSELFRLNPNNGQVTPIGSYLGVSFVSGGDFTPTVSNQPPVANAGGPYAIIEGQGVTLDASHSFDPDGDPLTYSWTINGQANAATGVSPTLTWSQLVALGVNDTGTFNVSVAVNDGHGNTTTASSTLTVNETSPTVSISGASSVYEGAVYALTLTFTDPSPVDPATSWTINWGDGSAPETVTGSPASVSHSFADGPNSYSIAASVTSDDGTFSATPVNVTVTNVAPIVTGLSAGYAPTWPGAGILDPTFGNGGVVNDTVDLGIALLGRFPIARQADGKYLVATNAGKLYRFNADGSPDTYFGNGGVVSGLYGGYANDIAIQSDGKILLSEGTSFSSGAVIRLNSNGTLDLNFGIGGVVDGYGVGIAGQGNLALQTDGKIIEAMGTTVSWKLVRFNSNGALDTNFGNNGIVMTSFPGPNSTLIDDVILQPDGKILVAGSANTTSSNVHADWAVARYNSNGSLDTSFGLDGVVITSLPASSEARTIALQADGRIVVGGMEAGGTGIVVRYFADGSLDNSFANGGIFSTSSIFLFRGLVVQPDGEIIAGGAGGSGSSISGGYFGLERLTATGSLDTSFGTNGLVNTPNGTIYAAFLQNDGKLVAAGFGSDGSFQLARYGDIAPPNAGPINENDVATLSGAISDPGVLDNHTVVIAWGDATPNTTLHLAAGVTNFTLTHQYLDNLPANAAYNITAMVTDKDNASGAGSTTLTVNNVAPSNVIVTPSASTINEGGSISVSGSFTDPGTLDSHNVVIDWGDGSPTTTVHLAAGVLTYSAGSHQYLNNLPGNAPYTITATVTDKDSGSGAGTTNVVVNNVAPTAQISGFTQPNPLFILQGDVLTFSGSFTDPGVLDSHTVTWNFGDGNTSTSSYGPGGSASFTANHGYAAPGTYTVTLTVTDSDGGVNSVQTTVVVDTPAQATAAIIPFVQSLTGLNAGQKNSLINLLNAVINDLNQGNTNAAKNKLTAFENKVNAFYSAGFLTQAEDNLLVSSADAIKNVI